MSDIVRVAEKFAPEVVYLRLLDLGAEVARLREALRRLVAAVDEYPGAYPDREEEIIALIQARAALAPKEEA